MATSDQSESVDLNAHLVEALREDVGSLESELDALRASLRYRVGDLVVQLALSPIRGGFRTLPRLARLLLGARRRAVGSADVLSVRSRADDGMNVQVVVLGHTIPDGHGLGQDVWITDDAAAVSRRIDEGSPGCLVLRRAAPVLLRRLERARLAGWRVIWWPEQVQDDDRALVCYARAHCDECLENGA